MKSLFLIPLAITILFIYLPSYGKINDKQFETARREFAKGGVDENTVSRLIHNNWVCKSYGHSSKSVAGQGASAMIDEVRYSFSIKNGLLLTDTDGNFEFKERSFAFDLFGNLAGMYGSKGLNSAGISVTSYLRLYKDKMIIETVSRESIHTTDYESISNRDRMVSSYLSCIVTPTS